MFNERNMEEEIWIIKEYGQKESGTIISSIVYPIVDLEPSVVCQCKNLHIVDFSLVFFGDRDFFPV